MTAPRRVWLWLIPLLLLVTGFGASRLDDDLLFVDEYWSIRNSGGVPFGPLSPWEMWNQVIEEDQGGMGMLYHGLLAMWEWLMGTSPYTVRSFSLLVGLLAIAWTYRLGCDLFSAQVGLYAAVVMGVSAFFIDYLHEARAYTLFALLVALTIWAYWRIVDLTPRPPLQYREGEQDMVVGTQHAASLPERNASGVEAFRGTPLQRTLSTHEPTFRHYLVFMLALAALAYTHYLALIFEAALGVYHLLFVRKTRRWWYVGLAAFGAAILYLPWLSVTLTIIGRGTQENRTAMDAGLALEQLLHLFSNGNIALLALLAVYALLERRRATVLLWFLALLTLALTLLVNARIPYLVHPRYFLMLWPILALLVAVGMVRLSQAGLPARIMLATWMVGGLWLAVHPQFIADVYGQVYRAPKAGVMAALDILRQRGQSEDEAIFRIAEPGYEHFQYFVLGYLMRDLPMHYDQDERMNNSFATDDNHYLTDVLTSLDDAPFVWRLIVPEVPTTQRSVVFNYVMDTYYTQCETALDRPDMHMTLYARRLSSTDQAPYIFGEGGQIRLFPLKTTVEGDVLRVVLYWAYDEGVPVGQYSVAVHVEDAVGSFLAQGDHALPISSCSTANIPLKDLSSGEYQLLIGVYDWQTNVRLPAMDVESGTSGDRTLVAEFSK